MSLRQAAEEFANLGVSRRVAARYAASSLKPQTEALIKKIDGIDAGAPKKEIQKSVNEITSFGRKLEKQLEQLDGKMDGKKLNRAIEHAQAVSAYGDNILRDAGDAAKVDRHLGGVQTELKEVLKLL